MKSRLLGGLLFVIAAFAFAQTSGGSPADGGDGTAVVRRTKYFEISADPEDADRLAFEMEERFSVYNRLFRFNPDSVTWPLKVRSFRDQDAYNRYVALRLDSENPGAVYLHYSQRDRRELVINSGSDGEAQALPYQAFIQFLRAFVSNPPAWMREGFAVFFSTLNFDDAGKFAYEENLAWLETVKSIANPPSPGEILMADVLGIPDEFQSLAWSMVSFLLNSGKRDYLRTVTDSFMLLSDTNSAEENAEVVMKRIFLWNNMEDMTNDYREYLDSRKTFNELLARGQQAYTAGEKENAVVAFRAAVDQRPTHFAPWYYLGLLAYEMDDYDSADEYYHSSIRCGADSALVHYALGLNAAAAGKNNEAVDFLRLAAAAAPDRYQEKANALIARLGEK